MLKLTVSVEQLRICEYLELLGWQLNIFGCYSANGFWVEFSSMRWYLFTEAGGDQVATGETLEELYFSLAESGALPVEQYFADEVGDEPRMHVSIKAALWMAAGSIAFAAVLIGAIWLTMGVPQ